MCLERFGTMTSIGFLANQRKHGRDSSPSFQLELLRNARSRHLRAATEALDTRQRHLENLRKVDVEIEQYEVEQRSLNRRRRVANLKLANAVYRDGVPRNLPGHHEIVHRYAFGRKERRAPRRRGSAGLIAMIRLREHERLISVRYRGQLPNDDGGADDLWIAAQLIRQHGGDTCRKTVDWAKLWAPWCSEQDANALALHVGLHPYKFTADTLAEKLNLTYAERQALGITAIGAIDVDREERERLRRQRSREKEKQKRRANGAVARDLYEEGSCESWRPWKDQGISRSTWYRRRAAARVQNEPERVRPSKPSKPSKPSQPTGRIAPSLGRIDDRFERESAAGQHRETGSRSAGCIANGCRTPVSTSFRAPHEPSPTPIAPCAIGSDPLARLHHEEGLSRGSGLGVPQNIRRSERIEELYERSVNAPSAAERRRAVEQIRAFWLRVPKC